jgi:hypothetical protein
VSDLTDSIQDLVGTTIHPKFHIPVDNNAQFQYEASFGVQNDGTMKNGLEVIAPAATPIKLSAAFHGQLFFSASPLQLPDDHLLTLNIAPAEALLLRTLFSEEMFSPVAVGYYPVDQKKVEKDINNALKTQGLGGDKLTKTLQAFIDGEIGVMVNPATLIGTAMGDRVTLVFEDGDGYALHPHYVLWRLWNAANQKLVFEPANHGLIGALQLINLILTLSDDQDIIGLAQAEPYRYAFP